MEINPFPYLQVGGNGLYTVHTKKNLRIPIQQQFYRAADDGLIESIWKEQWKKLGSIPTLLGVPSDAGGGIHRGANWGPLFLRQILIPYAPQLIDAGDILTIPQLTDDHLLNLETIKQIADELYADLQQRDLPVSPLSMLDHFATYYFKHFDSPLITLGGDHSITAPVLRHFITRYPKSAVLHFDAHTDLLTKRLGIKYCFATWAAEICQQLSDSKRFIQLGIRSSGRDKDHWEKNFPVTQHWSAELIKHHAPSFCRALIDQLKQQNVECLYLSFDLDVIDEQEFWSTGTSEPSGLSIAWLKSFLEELYASDLMIKGLDIVEFAPFVNMGEQQKNLQQSISSITSLVETLISGILTQSQRNL